MGRIGERTLTFKKAPYIRGNGGVAGKDEKEGPIGAYFNTYFNDDLWGEKSWELTERKMFIRAVENAVTSAGLTLDDIQILFGGDLLNQIISAGFAARTLRAPFIGLYGACSTMSESLLVGAMAVDGGYADNVVCATSSHFATAERQFRYPLELGTPKTPTSQHTATAAGATVLSSTGQADDARITCATPGRVIDLKISDANNMGAAMAPAAVETLVTHLEDTKRAPNYYDLIITGDLGTFGSKLLVEYTAKENVDVKAVYTDCGVELYKGVKDMYCGGSGCGCSALMFNCYYLKKFKDKKINRILLIATGALHSPTTSMQGESIPCIAHAVAIERGEIIWNI
ncbi:MAG: stage V sporulation protein AD [Eubacteriales bacterium]